MARAAIPLIGIHPHHARTAAHESLARRVLYHVLPRHLAVPVSFELRAALKLLTRRLVERRYRRQRGLRVNLGAGETGRPGWVNVDVLNLPGINCVYDCRKRLPFSTGSVKAIFSEHFLEHLDYTEEVPYFVSECQRVLEPGGTLRIIVPDAERYLDAYCSRTWDALAALRPLTAGRTDFYYGCAYNTKMELINVVFRQVSEHKFAYDFETLDFILRTYGFKEVTRRAFGDSRDRDLCLDLASRASESLYVEAVN
jgi:predicted SAM-dependent methyltransferase